MTRAFEDSSRVTAELAHAEHNFADKGRATVSLLPYGYVDGVTVDGDTVRLELRPFQIVTMRFSRS